MLRALLGSDLSRWVLAWKCRPGPLKDYYRQDTPTLDTPFDQAELLVIDLETTGLDANQDEIVSFGYVPIVGGRIRLAEAGSCLVRPTRPVGQESAKIHGLLDDRLAAAAPLEAALPPFLAALRGRIAVAHHAVIERAFLSRACERIYGQPLEVPFIDTLALERRLISRREQVAADGMLKLGACRARYNLPRLKAHDALVDALGCAELLLAQAANCGGRKAAPLRDLMV